MNKVLRKVTSVAISVAVMMSATVSALGAGLTDSSQTEMEIRHAELSKRAGTEGTVLLENNGVLPIANSGNVALFGVGAYNTIKGGTGSGAVNNRYAVNIREAFEAAGYNVTTNDVYYSAMRAATDALGGGGMWGGVDYSLGEVLLTDETVQPNEPTDTAIYTIARNSGEGSDRTATEGDYYLRDTERANIEKLAANYINVIVVINCGGSMNTNFFNEINAAITDPEGGDGIDALFHLTQAGQESGHVLVEVLNGTVTPSGKLTDTWASHYSYYPASETFAAHDGDSLQEDYVEGIYVGYRYFDSFYKTLNPSDPDAVINYEFGYGLSYTDFEITVDSVETSMDNTTVNVTVANVGDTFYGKEVVQVYYSAPTGGRLDQPYQELVAYAKTDLLAPGECQTLSIQFLTTYMSTYDEGQAAYVMEAGDYVLRVGNSSRNTEVAAVVNMPSTIITEQLSNQSTDEHLDDEWTSNPANHYSYDGEASEIAAADRFVLDATGFVAPNNASAYAQDVEVDEENYYYSIDRDLISTVTVYLDEDVTDWEGTGEAYKLKTGEVAEYIEPAYNGTLFDVYKGDITIEEFVAALSVTELANLVEGTSRTAGSTLASGAAGYTTNSLASKGVPQTSLPDGPAGVRINQSYTEAGVTYYQYCTAWPIATMLAQTWDIDLVEEVGRAIGEELLFYGGTWWLAPSLNLHRDPLCGRNFEYYSEDPLVSGITAAVTTRGVQQNPGVGVSLKHYAGNNQETDRSSSNDTVNERTLREMYLRGFEIATKSAKPMTYMSSYNKINGTYVAGDYDILYDILRGEWGFDGLVMTDWGGVRAGIVNCMYAGNDLIMPGGAPNDVINASLFRDGTLDVAGLPVYLWQSYGEAAGTSITYSWSVGSWMLYEGGELLASTTIDESTNLTVRPSSGQIISSGWWPSYNYIDPHMTVDNAYNHTIEMSTRTDVNLTATQRSGIEVVVNETDAGGAVTSYTVNLYGEHMPTMRQGDLQRSAINILNVIIRTDAFGQLAEANGEDVEILPYLEYYNENEVVDYIVVEKSAIGYNSYNVLGSLLAEAEEILNNTDPADYTTSWEALQSAYELALAIYNSPVAGDGDYTSAANTLALYLELLTVRADASMLQGLLDSHDEQLDQNNRTEESWAVYAEARAAAEAVLADRDATAQDIQDAYVNLVLAANNLEYNTEVNKEALEYLVDLAKEVLETGDFTDGSGAALEAAIVAAEVVLADPDATKQDVTDAQNALLVALEELINAANKDWLAVLINTANALSADGYTAASWSNLQTALATATAVYDDGEAHQDAVDAAADRLWQAINGLVFSVDFSALSDAITSAERIVNNADAYAPESIEGLAEELAKAKVMLDEGVATQARVNAQTESLLELVAKARLKADMSRLNAAIRVARSVSTAAYTPASVQAMSMALDNAVTVSSDVNAYQKTVDDATEALVAAFSALVPKAPDTDKGGDTNTPTAPGGNKDDTKAPAAPAGNDDDTGAPAATDGNDATGSVETRNNGSLGITVRVGGGTTNRVATVNEDTDEDVADQEPADEEPVDEAPAPVAAEPEAEEDVVDADAAIADTNPTPLANAETSQTSFILYILLALAVVAGGTGWFFALKNRKEKESN